MEGLMSAFTTVHTPGAAGAVIVAIESSSAATLEIVGGTVIGASTLNLGLRVGVYRR